MQHATTRTTQSILVLTGDLPSMVNHRAHLIRRLAREGYRVLLIGGGEPVDVSALEELGVVVERIEVARLSLRPGLDLRGALTIRSAIVRHWPQVVHAFSLKMIMLAKLVMLWMSLIGAHRALVLSFAGLGRAFEDRPGSVHRLRQKLIIGLLNFGGRRLSQQVTVENAEDERRLRAHGLSQSVPVILIKSTGINFEVFAPREKTGGISVLFASRALRAKGASIYLDAVKRLAPLHAEASFAFAGWLDPSDPDRVAKAELDALKGFGNFRYLGNVPTGAMPEVLAGMDLVCLPSTYNEGVPRILMEAAACGASYVSTPQPGWVDVVGDEPESGWLLPAVSVDAVAGAIEAALAAPEETRIRGQKARAELLAAKVSEQDVQEGFLAVYAAAQESVDRFGSKEAIG